MKVTNAKSLPKVYYGLHMVEGVAEYREPNAKPYRILIGEDAIKNMDPSFQGRPVFVHHVDGVDLDKIQEEADGYVVESFFNQADGKHWVKFIVVSDRGHEAIRNGWKLSNAYVPKEFTGGGLWHGVEYQKEVTRGEYEHLAIVSNPRYEESVIMTPEDFKSYNGEKELELKRLANSQHDEKGESEMKLNFFKKQKVENSADLETTAVVLPKSGKEVTISQLVANADDMEMNMGKPMMANGDHKVKVGEEEMTVNELVAKHMDMCNELAEMKKPKDAAAEDDKKENDAVDDKAKDAKDAAPADKKENDAKDGDGDEDEKKKKIEEKKSNAADGKKHFDAIKNAPDAVLNEAAPAPDLSEDRVARGKARYGS